jgi:dinuclear metal center YbgI/SA1388 family protein
MLKVRDYYEFMDKWAPFEEAESYDNVGLLVGNMDDDVIGVLLTLDITPDVILEAKEKGANLIIAHHPIIFGGTNDISFNSASGMICYMLAQNSMSAICAHTNLDAAESGVSDTLAEAIGLINIKGVNSNTMMRVGDMPEAMTTKEFALHVKKCIDAGRVQVAGKVPDKIRKVAVLGGGAGQYYMEAKKTGADIFLTGASKHHEGLAVATMNFCMMDAGHYETEVPILKIMHAYLQKCINEVQSISTISMTCVRTGPFEVLC